MSDFLRSDLPTRRTIAQYCRLPHITHSGRNKRAGSGQKSKENCLRSLPSFYTSPPPTTLKYGAAYKKGRGEALLFPTLPSPPRTIRGLAKYSAITLPALPCAAYYSLSSAASVLSARESLLVSCPGSAGNLPSSSRVSGASSSFSSSLTSTSDRLR